MTTKASCRSLSRRQFTLGVAGAAALNLVAPAARAQGQPKLLRVRLGSDIANLDPARIFQVENQTVATQVYSGLARYDEKTNNIVADLATNWDVSADGTVYTFHLRKNVQWHKNFGTLTSDDVRFSFERVLDPKTGSNYTGQLAAISKIDTPDANTVVITLKAPNSGFMHKMTNLNQGWIVSRKAVTEMGDRKHALNPIGTGPFVFESWTPGQEVRISANKAYFGGAPKVDGVLFRVIRDENAAATALTNGEIDIFFALQEPAVIARLKEDANVKVLDRPADHTINFVLNMNYKPLDDLRVRQAIMHGINRDALIAGLFKGTKGSAYSVLTPAFLEYTEDVPKYPYDPVKARALLAAAGQPSFSMDIIGVGFSPYDKIVVPIASDLSAIGIKTRIQVLERGAYLQARSGGKIPNAITGVVGAPDPDSPIISMLAKSSFPPGLNTSHYAGVDDLITQAAAAKDEPARKAAYQKILQKSMTDLPVVPLYADRLFIAHSNKVQGFVQNSLFTMNAYPVSLA